MFNGLLKCCSRVPCNVFSKSVGKNGSMPSQMRSLGNYGVFNYRRPLEASETIIKLI